jgi:hypothetical protein
VGEYTVRDVDRSCAAISRQPLFPGVLLVGAAATGRHRGTKRSKYPAMTGLKLTAMRGVKILGTASRAT